ncbi:MAG TPA: diguanylate cyclase [Clostridiaceae bacterium]|jgi:c-di-AMP phosphodiesterase-like protein|nr:diguanylate cyclase [Clostridiaceae bacterium]
MKGKFSIRKVNMALINFVIAAAFIANSIYISAVQKIYTNVLVYILLLVAVILLNIVIAILKRKAIVKIVSGISFHMKEGKEGSIRDFHLPLLFINESGELIWHNKHFANIFEKKKLIRKTVNELFLLKIKSKLIENDTNLVSEVYLEGRTYQMLGNIIKAEKEEKRGFYIMLYFIDITEMVKLRQKYEDEKLAVGIIVIDSYEEIYRSSGEAVVNEIFVELNRIFDEWLKGKGAIIRRLIRDRYVLLAENHELKEFEKNKFVILDKAKNINVGNKIPVSLSIGIAKDGETIEENYKNAEMAVELALGRGGDQAIVRSNNKDTYYGGSNIEMERRTKVRARVISNLLKEEIDKSSRVIIMGHNNCDMDSLGASLALYRACCLRSVKANIVLNSVNQSIAAIMEKLSTMEEYEEVFINSSYALNIIDDNTLVIVVDTYNKELTECPKLLDYASRIALIDHHRRGSDFIKNTVIDYAETYASSTSELLVEILMYFEPNVTIPPIEAEALYAGILVDTKNFTFKTGTRTFEAASFLRAQGVDTISVKQYFQPDIQTFIQVCDVATSAEIVYGNMSIAVCGSDIKNPKFISALAADQMLNVAGIDATFVLCEIGGVVYISARSLGAINVQVILEKLGGGGHLTAAGAAIKDVSIQYAKKSLIEAIESYIN